MQKALCKLQQPFQHVCRRISSNCGIQPSDAAVLHAWDERISGYILTGRDETGRLCWLHVTPDASVLNGGSARERAVSIISAHQLQHLRTDATVLCSRFNLPRAKYLNADSVHVSYLEFPLAWSCCIAQDVQKSNLRSSIETEADVKLQNRLKSYRFIR